jgi:aryl-alcohol dehydrogenase-like predicted oxidoreductase
VQYRTLGQTGLEVSALALGTLNFANGASVGDARAILRRAIEAGINLIDTADSYANGESERLLGALLREAELRDRIILISKVYYPTGPRPPDRGLGRDHIMKACEGSLRRLQTDYVDIYLAHRSDSAQVPIEETLGALNDLVLQGKVRHIGCSTHPAWEVLEAIKVSETKGYAKYVLESPPYNLLDRRIENELIPLCQKYGLGILPWSPLAMGVLAGRYEHGAPFPQGSRAAANGKGIYAQRVSRAGVQVAGYLAGVAKRFGLSPGQAALLWVKDQPGVTSPIVGPRRTDHLEEMLIVADMHADDGLRMEMDRLNPPGTAVANFHNTSGWMKMRITRDASQGW